MLGLFALWAYFVYVQGGTALILTKWDACFASSSKGCSRWHTFCLHQQGFQVWGSHHIRISEVQKLTTWAVRLLLAQCSHRLVLVETLRCRIAQ